MPTGTRRVGGLWPVVSKPRLLGQKGVESGSTSCPADSGRACPWRCAAAYPWPVAAIYGSVARLQLPFPPDTSIVSRHRARQQGVQFVVGHWGRGTLLQQLHALQDQAAELSTGESALVHSAHLPTWSLHLSRHPVYFTQATAPDAGLVCSVTRTSRLLCSIA